MLNYLQFLIKSTNQHGVHSPFVFQYITKGLYSKKRFVKNLPKNMKWVLQSLQYFQPDKVYCNSNEIKQLFKHEELQFVDNIQDAQIGFIKSTNQHGVHSPFVFQYITKGLYSKKRFVKNLPKNMKWVLQSLQYFQPDKVYCNSNEIKQLFKHEELQFVDNIQDAQIGVIN